MLKRRSNQSINQSDKHSLYEWAAWEEIIMEIYNEELRKMEERRKKHGTAEINLSISMLQINPWNQNRCMYAYLSPSAKERKTKTGTIMQGK